MSNNLLYFPYIDIPNNAWTIKSILYWDKIGIIVPPKYAEKPKQHKKYTLDLLHTELVEQVFPYEYTYKIRRFDEEFIRMVSQPQFNIEKRKRNFKSGIYSRIHIQKFGERLLNQLVQMQIAKHIEQDWDWYYVESKTARLLMIYLATTIGKLGDFTPATDNIDNLDTSLSQKNNTFKLNRIRQNLINDLIPYPIDPDLIQLRKFKDKYHEELTSFRLLVEQIALELSFISKDKHREMNYELKMAEITDKKAKILSDLNQSRIGQISFGTICGIAGAIVGFKETNNTLAYFSLANAVYSAFQGYDRSSVLSRDYSYLALIDNKLVPREG
jgi:hypothetical protein